MNSQIPFNAVSDSKSFVCNMQQQTFCGKMRIQQDKVGTRGLERRLIHVRITNTHAVELHPMVYFVFLFRDTVL